MTGSLYFNNNQLLEVTKSNWALNIICLSFNSSGITTLFANLEKSLYTSLSEVGYDN